MLVNNYGDPVQHPIVVKGIQYPPNIEELWSDAELWKIGLVRKPDPVIQTPPVVTPEAPTEVAVVPLWAARAVLKKEGMFQLVDDFVEANKTTHPEWWEAWNTGNVVRKSSPLVQMLISDFNAPPEKVDDMFTQANAISA